MALWNMILNALGGSTGLPSGLVILRRSISAPISDQVEIFNDDLFGLGMAAEPIGDQVVGPVAFVGHAVFHQRVIESADMPRGHPGFGVQQDLRIDADHIGAAGDQLVPPQVADAAQHFGAQGAVIVRTGQPAVDFRSGKDKATALGQGNNFF